MEKPESECLSFSVYAMYVCLSTVAFFSLCYFFPFYYETGSESHFKIITSGVFSGSPQGIFNSFGAHIIVGRAISFLYHYLPAINWYDCFICLAHGILLGHILLILGICSKEYENSKKLFVFGVFLFVAHNFIALDPTRLSLLLTASSMALFLNFQFSTLLRIWVFSMFFLGLLVRIESGVLAVLFVTIAEFAYKGLKKEIFRGLSYFYVILLLILGFINLPLSDEEENYMKIRPYQFALWDYYNEFPEVTFESQRDSVVFYSATKAFMADESKINEAFFKRIGLKSTDKTLVDLLNYIVKVPYQLSRAVDFFQDFVSQQKVLWLNLLLIIAIILLHYKQVLQTFFIMGAILTSLIAISILMKMVLRLFFPMLCILVLLTFFYGRITASSKLFKIPLRWSVIVVLFSSFNLFSFTDQYTEERSAYTKAIYWVKQELHRLPEFSIVFLDLATTIHWYNYMFEEEVMVGCKVIPMDNGLIYLTNSHQNKLDSTFGCHEFSCYMEKFLNMENAYFLAAPERKEIFENYMKVVYGIPVNFKAHKTIDFKEHPDVPPLSIYSVSRNQKSY